jgi:hypothetical protein
MSINRERIVATLKTASDWESKGDWVWALRNYSLALMGMLSQAVEGSSNLTEGAGVLVSLDTGAQLTKYVDVISKARADVELRKSPWSVLDGAYKLLVFSHLSTILKNDLAATYLLELANAEGVLELAGKFWKGYARALLAFERHRPFARQAMKLAGQERYWVKYLDLMSNLSEGKDVQGSIAEVDEAFAARNRDKRIKDDNFRIEGSGLHPVRWDFRKDAILGLAASRAAS